MDKGGVSKTERLRSLLIVRLSVLFQTFLIATIIKHGQIPVVSLQPHFQPQKEMQNETTQTCMSDNPQSY